MTQHIRHSTVRRRVLAALALVALPFGGSALAQGKYPEKPITFVVPFAAGSATDQLARALGQSITEQAKQAVVVDNKAGASGQIAAQAAAKSAPDGYTVLITTNTTHAANEHLYTTLPYDPVKDFVPVTGLGRGGQVEMLWSAFPSLAGFVKDGRVKLLATNAAQRSALAPDLPAIAELVPGFDFAPIVGVLAPAGTPKGIIDKIAAEVVAVTKMPDAVQAFAVAGIDPVGGGSEAYASAIADENARMAKAIQAAGLKPE